MAVILSEEEKKTLCRNMATNLPLLRAKGGLSQDELAEKLGFSRQTISAIETGKRDMQWSTFTAIALFFSKDSDIKKLMVLMEIINDAVEEVFSVKGN